MSEIRVAREWDSVPPVLYDGDEAISTRVLEHQHRTMREALREIASQKGGGVVASHARMTLNDVFGKGNW